MAWTILPAQRETLGQQVVGHFTGGKFADQLALLVAQAFFLQAGIDARPQQHRVERLGQVILGAHLDAARHAVHLVQ